MKLYPDPATVDETLDFPLSESIGEIQKRNLRAFEEMDGNTRIAMHPVRIAMDDCTAVTGVINDQVSGVLEVIETVDQ